MNTNINFMDNSEIKEIIDDIMDHQSLHPEKEVCGFIIEQNGKQKCWPITNISKDSDMFVLDPRETYRIFVSMNPIAIYHTHVKGDTTPSEFDKQTNELSCLPMWIVDQNRNLNIYDNN